MNKKQQKQIISTIYSDILKDVCEVGPVISLYTIAFSFLLFLFSRFLTGYWVPMAAAPGIILLFLLFLVQLARFLPQKKKKPGI